MLKHKKVTGSTDLMIRPIEVEGNNLIKRREPPDDRKIHKKVQSTKCQR